MIVPKKDIQELDPNDWYQLEQITHGCFVDTKQEANEQRRYYKKMGRCSCYTKTIEGKWYVTSCKTRFCFCKPKRKAR